MPGSTAPTVESVLDDELRQVEASRQLRLGNSAAQPKTAESLIGLAFSGGGIRSATFNLGILQALAHARLLRTVDYLSTVSGGGYIGGWLMAWMHHQGIGVQRVEELLSASPNAPRESAEAPEVHFLRSYSNYLTPRKGMLGADFWAFATSYVRNALLNQVILVLALLSLLLMPRTFVYLLHLLENAEEAFRGRFADSTQAYFESQYFALGLGLVLAFVAVVFIGLNLISVDPRRKRRDCWFASQQAVQILIVIPLFLSAALFTYGMGSLLTEWKILEYPLYRAPLLGIALYGGLWAGALGVRAIVRAIVKTTGNGGPKVWLILSTAAITGAACGYLFVPLATVLSGGGAAGPMVTKWHTMAFGTPLTIAIMLLTGVLHIGLMGRGMTDAHREWWARLAGWLVIYTVCWLFLFLIAVYFPAGLGRLLNWESNRHPGHPLTFTGVLLWIASTAYGVAFGKSDRSSKLVLDASLREKLLHYLARLAPYVFILGLLMGLSLLASTMCIWIAGIDWPTLALPSDWDFDGGTAVACVVLFLGAVVFSWRVDINEFSVHHLYRNRLVRCYLGASVPGRRAQPFIGFSDADNFPLANLQIPLGSEDTKDARPIPILNTSLNVVRGKELALQTRKARSFAFTPLYGGFTRHPTGKKAWESFFGPTAQCGCQLPGFKDGITLGTSIAISGAAASPSMGSYSEPALAFLMTLFDVRLGWWMGNPAGKCWRHGSPLIGFYWLLRELLGATNDDSAYVYLSDGGHFENLALYELVRRRCKLIVACDASCDPNGDLGDLHNAIERCRSDFGVEIVLENVAALKPQARSDGSVRSQAHFVAGKIRYNPASANEDGTIIYVKPTLVDGDPQDVLAHAKAHSSFPNDTTANQWFDETHFENYRTLGQAAGESAVERIRAEVKRVLS